MKLLTVERLKEVIHYDPETGMFRWIIKKGCKSAGSTAGTPHKNGRYVQIMINRSSYRAHRLAWLYMTGSWPENTIDHINGDGCDNRFSNLRDINHCSNMQNQSKPHSRNTSGFLGVSKQGDKFRPRLSVDGRNISFGLYDTAEEAHEVYLGKKRELHAGCTI